MAFKPTDSQRKAIVTIDRPVAVVAGAGSGKTWVLVERYLHLLDQGFTTDEIAAITFTKKAAQEMKERLREARPQLAASLERAQISTIHSLCQRIIQEHPLQARLDPRFRVGEEWETRLLLAEVIEEIVAETEIPTELGTAGEVSALVLDLYEKMLSKGDLRFQRSFPEPLGEFPLQELEHRTEQVLRLTPSTPRQGEVLEQLAEEWPYLRELLRLGDADLRLEALEILQKLVGGIRGKLAEHTAALKVLIASAQQIITEGRGRVILTYLGEVLQRVHGLYSERKRLGGLVDFGNLERLTCQLLEDPQVVADYPFKHIMVDEFQDTNPLQKRIVDAFTAQGAVLFVVGDPKQSIYRFRGAEVGVFVQTQREVAETGKGIFLETNFRSRPELIKFCNQFFHRLLAGEPIGFEPSEADKPAAGRPCVSILLTPAEALSADEARAAEAEQIALQIRELVEGGRYKYEDISILFRATTSMYIYEQALKKAGIPYVNLSGRGFYAKQEIQDVLHYFRWLEDSGDEVAKMAVLRSPFYLLSDEGLYWLRRGELDRLTPKEQEALARAEEDYSASAASGQASTCPRGHRRAAPAHGLRGKDLAAALRPPEGGQHRKAPGAELGPVCPGCVHGSGAGAVPAPSGQGSPQGGRGPARCGACRCGHPAHHPQRQGPGVPRGLPGGHQRGGRAHPGRQGALPSRVRPGLPGNGRLRAGQGAGQGGRGQRGQAPALCGRHQGAGGVFLVRPDGQGGQRQLVELVSGASAPH